MRNKTFTRLLLFSLFGMAMWFFGNLYEGIVIAPNMLNGSGDKIKLWQGFFTTTNPIFFYIPISPIAMAATLFLYLKASNNNVVLKKHLRYATIFGLIALILGIIIITQINFKLFYGNVIEYGKIAYKLSLLWNILNVIRIALLGVTISNLFKAFSLTAKT